MKSIYLVDSVEKKPHEIPESKTPIKIGRNPDICGLVTPSYDKSISRIQSEIRYVANQITFRQISRKSRTYIGTKENLLERQLQPDENQYLAIGNIITMGSEGYQLEIKLEKDMRDKLKKIREEQISDTVKTKLIG